MPQRPTSPLDEIVPWAIELRVVGTPHMIHVPASESIMVGRGDPKRGMVPEVDLTPYAAHVLGVSRQHARISVLKDRVVVRDLGSANGTFLNGHVLSPNEDYRLRHGDQLSFGQLHLQVNFSVTPATEEKTKAHTLTGDTPADPTLLGNGQHILVVDDDADVARIFANVLERTGFKVTIVSNAAEAIHQISTTMPSAVILEVILPDMSGLDLARYVRKQPKGKDVPMVALGSSGGFHLTQSQEAGVDLFLSKPVGLDEIMKALAKIVQKMPS
jgi:CheY-like chemotaxis protein